MSQKKKVYLVANAHLDTQWNWTVKDSIRTCIRKTLEENLDLIEKFPHYRMNFEGAFRYRLAKEYYPDLYEKMKARIAEGRWNVAGAFWDACDVNTPSSEALMRQVLLGNGYFEKEFGKRSYDIFLVDCFGFRHALPSIGAHMGLKGFSTQKLNWGVGTPILVEGGEALRPVPDETSPRMDLGKWVGPDGNYLVACFNENFYSYHFEHYGEDPINQRELHKKEVEHNEKYAGVAVRNLYYGIGDEGGSCGEVSAAMAEAAFCDPDGGFFETISASSDQIFLELTEEQIAGLPIYRDGLPIPHGYGAMTSHTINKRWNRKNELLADAAERASVLAALRNGRNYPAAQLDFAWKQFLWHQFHDDITGTSAGDVYQISNNDLALALNLFASELKGGVASIASSMNTEGEGTPILVYNPIADRRRDVVTVELARPIDSVRVFAPNGKEVPAQISRIDGRPTIRFVADTAPVSFGIYRLVEGQGSCQLDSSLVRTKTGIENARYRVALNETGDIASIYDKVEEKELLSSPAVLEIFPDGSTEWPSWELHWEDYSETPVCLTEVTSLSVEEEGPAVLTLRVERKHNASVFVQKIRLFEGGERVDVENEVHWEEKASMLLAKFPLTVSNPLAEFDGGLGCIKGANNNYPYFQHNVHQFADLTDEKGDFGVSIYNDCKYGMDKPDDHTLRLTLIHTPPRSYLPASGQDTQDMGRNFFRYAISSHNGDRAHSAAEGAAVNQPLMAFFTEKHSGDVNEISFLSISDERVQVRAIKKEEKGERIIVRVQETRGVAIDNVVLSFAFPIRSTEEVTGYEDPIAPMPFDGNSFSFSLTPYAVRTFAVTFASGTKQEEEFLPLALPYDTKVVTAQGDTTVEGITIPAELYEERITSAGIPFTLGGVDDKQALVCDGQQLTLSEECEVLYLLAASRGGDKEVTFRVGDKETILTVCAANERVGAWDLRICEQEAFVKTEDVAVCYTHTHENGADRLYEFANLFRYCLHVGGNDTVTLPKDPDVLLYAMTAAKASLTLEPTAPLYDVIHDGSDVTV